MVNFLHFYVICKVCFVNITKNILLNMIILSWFLIHLEKKMKTCSRKINHTYILLMERRFCEDELIKFCFKFTLKKWKILKNASVNLFAAAQSRRNLSAGTARYAHVDRCVAPDQWLVSKVVPGVLIPFLGFKK